MVTESGGEDELRLGRDAHQQVHRIARRQRDACEARERGRSAVPRIRVLLEGSKICRRESCAATTSATPNGDIASTRRLAGRRTDDLLARLHVIGAVA